MDTTKDNDFSVSDAESRRLGGVVPAPGSSSSCDGPQTTGGLPTGPPVGYATAVVKLERVRPGGPSTSKASTIRKNSNPCEIPTLDSDDDTSSVCSSVSGKLKSSKRKMSIEDIDTDGRHEPKGSKSRKTSILSGDDFEGYGSSTSDASDVRRTDFPIRVENPKNPRRSMRGQPIASSSDSSSTLTEAGENLDLNAILKQDPRQVILDRLTNDEIQRLGCLGLDSIEETRRACVNSLQGECSGRLKKRGALLREILNVLHERMEGNQDSSSSFLKMRVNQISSQMRKLQSDFDSLRQDYAEARETIRSLSVKLGKAEEENRRLKRLEKEGTYLAPKPLPSASIEDKNAMRPPPPPKDHPAKKKDKTHRSKTSRPSYAEAASTSSARPKPRIVENRKVTVTVRKDVGAMQPTPPPPTQREWEVAESRRKKKRTAAARKVQSRSRSCSESRRLHPPSATPSSKASSSKKKKKGDVVRTRRVPRTAAIVLTDNMDPAASGKLLTKARKEIDLGSLGIEGSKIRRAATGGVIIEIGGVDRDSKADVLAKKLKAIYDFKITVARPVTKGEMRIYGLDDSITPLDIKEVISKVGSCKQEDVTLGDIKKMARGLNMVWAKCPLQAAVAITSKGKFQVGWTEVRAELLRARPTQCYRCWQYGHLAATCPAQNTNRVGSCFNCGGTDHYARTCSNAPHCVLCADAKREACHRLGSSKCPVERKMGVRADFRKPVNPASTSTAEVTANMDVGS